jgi:putative chitinase
MKLTTEQLASMISTNTDPAGWCKALNEALPKYGIDTEVRIAAFISQCAHESRDFTSLLENLNYSEKALRSVFGRYFGEGKRDPAEYARKPEKIANYVYMDKYRSTRGALGNVEDGDGWRFRGKGLKQVTGRNNVTNFAKAFDMTAEEASDWLETKEGALASALWFWDSNNLNPVADTGDVRALTKRINGGDIGLDDRRHRYENALAVLGGKAPVLAQTNSVLRKGSKGGAVARMQERLGLTPDGDFGPATEAAVRLWQSSKGLTADGIIGPKSLAMMSD